MYTENLCIYLDKKGITEYLSSTYRLYYFFVEKKYIRYGFFFYFSRKTIEIFVTYQELYRDREKSYKGSSFLYVSRITFHLGITQLYSMRKKYSRVILCECVGSIQEHFVNVETNFITIFFATNKIYWFYWIHCAYKCTFLHWELFTKFNSKKYRYLIIYNEKIFISVDFI